MPDSKRQGLAHLDSVRLPKLEKIKETRASRREQREQREHWERMQEAVKIANETNDAAKVVYDDTGRKLKKQNAEYYEVVDQTDALRRT